MSKASGIVLIVAGMAVAAYVLPSGELTRGADFARFSDVTKPPAADNASARGHRPARAQARHPTAAGSRGAGAVLLGARRRHHRPASERAGHEAAPMPRDRDAIGRELQKELKRVGCYDGELNGAWTTSTSQAMKALHRSRQRVAADGRARQHPADAGAGLSGPRMRQAVPGGPRPERRRPLRAERHPGARRQEAAGAGRAAACARACACRCREAHARHHRLDDHDHGLRAAGCDAADRRCAARGPHGAGWPAVADGSRGDAARRQPPPAAAADTAGCRPSGRRVPSARARPIGPAISSRTDSLN